MLDILRADVFWQSTPWLAASTSFSTYLKINRGTEYKLGALQRYDRMCARFPERKMCNFLNIFNSISYMPAILRIFARVFKSMNPRCLS